MSYPVVKAPIQKNLDCYTLALPVSRLSGFLGHDPRSRNWKSLKPYLHDIYKAKQRPTARPRIDALKTYIFERLLDNQKFGALPPISVFQMEPIAEAQLEKVERGSFGQPLLVLHEDRMGANRVLIDGLARVTAMLDIYDKIEVESADKLEDINAFEFSVSLYTPSEKPIGSDIAGQLFTDFNSYAWPVSAAKTIADDIYNPYKICANVVGKSEVLRRHGGLKIGTPNLGKKDVAFTTELTMSQFCKVAIEGRRGYGKLNKPVSNPKVSDLDPAEFGNQIAGFLAALENAMGTEVFADRSQIFRTAHGLYAIAVVINDVLIERRTTAEDAVRGIASIDWTWSNEQLQQAIGRRVEGGPWKLNTGTATFNWLIQHCREQSGIVITPAKAA